MPMGSSNREARISTGFGRSIPVRSGGSSTVAPFFADKEYFRNAFKPPRPETAYGFTTPRYVDLPLKTDYAQLITTGKHVGFGTGDGIFPDATDDMKAKEKGAFRCKEMPIDGKSPYEITSENTFDAANKYLKRITLKLFNFTVCPSQILYGIVYLKVAETMKVYKIEIDAEGVLRKEVNIKSSEITEIPNSTFSTNVVSNSGHGDWKSAKNYKAQTENYSGKDVYSRLKLTPDLPTDDTALKPFGGPITLEQGTHAIPFALRVPAESPPSVRIKEEVSGRRIQKELFENIYRLKATLEVVGPPRNEEVSLTTRTLPLHVYSCGGLPGVVNGKYSPGHIQKVDLSYKNSQVLMIFERIHVTSDDFIRIYLFSNNKKAARTAYAEFFLTTNLPDIGLIDSQKEPGLKLISRSKKQPFEMSFGQKYFSRVGERYPIQSNTVSNGYFEEQVLDANAEMPEHARASGCLLELKVIKNLQPSVAFEGATLYYYVRTTIDVRNDRKDARTKTDIFVHDRLLQNCHSS